MDDRFLNPNDELMNMEEWKTLSAVRHFQNSLYVFNTNHNELSLALAAYCDAPEGDRLMNVNRRHQLDLYFSEILRRNHNFVQQRSR